MLCAKPQVELHGIHGRYATALFDSAIKLNKVDAIEADLKKIQSAIKADAKLSNFLETPIIDKSAKIEGVKKMLQKGNYTPATLNFFQLLAENGRLDQTEKIFEGYAQLLAAHRGIVKVVVTSAKVLEPKTLQQIEASLAKSKLVHATNKVDLIAKVDPQVLGGFIVEVDGKTLDLSVSAKINKLNRLLTEAVWNALL